MAFRATKVEEIEFLAESFRDIADSLKEVAGRMKEADMPSIVLQLESIRQHYLSPCERLASNISMHFKDQLRCRDTGEEPMWQKSVRKSAYNKALKESKENLDSLGIVKKVPKKAAKKAVKKKRP